MSNEVKVPVKLEIIQPDSDEYKKVFKDVEDKFEDILTKLGKAIPDQVGKSMGDVYKELGTNYDELTKSLGKSAQGALADSLSPIFHGEMDKVEQIWGKAWDNMTQAAQKQLSELTGDLLSTAVKLPYNIFKESVWDPEKWFKDNVVGTVKIWGRDAKDWLVKAMGGIKKPADDYHQPVMILAAA